MCWCCWPFVDAWLEDPIEEASKHSRYHEKLVYSPPGKARSFVRVKRTKTTSDRVSIPSGNARTVKSSKKAGNGNDWVYIPDDGQNKKTKPKSDKVSPKSSKSSVATGSTVATGYDGYNGLRKYTYHSTDEEKKDATKAEQKDEKKPEECVCAPPPPAAQQQVYYMMSGFPQPQYASLPQYMAYPAPAYYGYPPPGYPGMPFNGMQAYYPPAAAAAAAVVEDKKDDKKEEKAEKKNKHKQEVKKWQGRTKAEVEEDNMKIAKNEGVCDARKVEPKGLKEDQMVWCVEVDGSHTLRAFAAIKDFKGEWKADPRFKDSWYFVRAEQKEE